MIKSHPIIIRSCVILACTMLGGLTIKWKWDAIPTDYQSLAMVVLGSDAAKNLSPGDSERALRELAEYLVSPEMDLRASDRVKRSAGLEKGGIAFPPGEIQSIRCAAGKEPGSILIFAVGTEGKYTRQYLNALLDELMQDWEANQKTNRSDLESIRLMEKLHVLKFDLDSINHQIAEMQSVSTSSPDQMQKLRDLGEKAAGIKQQQADLKLLLDLAKSKERKLQLRVEGRSTMALRNTWQAPWNSIFLYALVGACVGISLVSLSVLIGRHRPPPLPNQARTLTAASPDRLQNLPHQTGAAIDEP